MKFKHLSSLPKNVHSFSDKEDITPWQVNEIALELAEKLFPDKEGFILNMEYEGYMVRWDDAHKSVSSKRIKFLS